jgi:hypothetical protein
MQTSMSVIHSVCMIHNFITKERKGFLSSKPAGQSYLHILNFNSLNAELNPICHLIILLGDLTFMGKCIVSISKKMQRYTVYLCLETALYVLGGTSTHHQERIQLYLQHLIYVTPLLLSLFSTLAG